MPKRRLEASEQSERSSKIQRISHSPLSTLSDELQLRILSYLPVGTLAQCQSVSRSLKSISADPGLWRAAYYDAFVLPRVARLARRRRRGVNNQYRSDGVRSLNWLDEADLLEDESNTDWKRRYKVRHRWSKGLCDLEEVALADSPPPPPMLGRMLDGIIYTADKDHGLRAWSYKSPRKQLAMLSWSDAVPRVTAKPTSMAVSSRPSNKGTHDIVLGYEDGSLRSFTNDSAQPHFRMRFSVPPTELRSPVCSLAISGEHLVALSVDRALSLYRYVDAADPLLGNDTICSPTLLKSMRSHSIGNPFTSSLRSNGDALVVSLAYAVPMLGSNWSTCLQELHFDNNGNLLDSRFACAATSVESSFVSSLTRNMPMSAGATQRSTSCRPTSISYFHPYLLMAHANNVLTLHVVTTNATSLQVSSGTRLWGHTSSVLEANVGPRGRAVSVSSRGRGSPEVRVWQLENAASVLNKLGNSFTDDYSVKLAPEVQLQRTTGLSKAGFEDLCTNWSPVPLGQPQDSITTRGCVGFDGEHVVILKESGLQMTFAVYDFT